MVTTKKRIGRPMKKVVGRDRVALGLRVRAEVKQIIDQKAKQSGRTQSQEAEDLIERCLQFETHMQAMGTTMEMMEKQSFEAALFNAEYTPFRERIDGKVWKAWLEPGHPRALRRDSRHEGQHTRRGEHSWRLKFDAGRDSDGERKIQYVTFRGTKREAQIKLASLITAVGSGSYVEPSKLSVAAFVRGRVDVWEASGDITARTAKRYRQLVENQIAPHLGDKPLQKLTRLDIETMARDPAHWRAGAANHRPRPSACLASVERCRA